MDQFDALIIGQGLAGSALAWRLVERGLSVAVIDRGGVDAGGRPSASRVAAGLITPITGKRLTIAADWDAMRVEAERFYRRVEQATGERFFHARPALRLLGSEDERARLQQRMEDPTFAKHAQPIEGADLTDTLHAPYGAFWMPAAARLVTRGFLSATRWWLERNGRVIQTTCDPHEDLRFEAGRAVCVSLGVAARVACFCQGWGPTTPDGLFPLPLEPAKGEVLRVAAPTLAVDHTLHRGVWLAPTGDGEYLLGATHAWDDLDATPTAAARAELLAGAAAVTDSPFEVIDHQAAIRPATADRKPLVGVSPSNPRVAWLNGLGAKGSLWAPWYAGQLAEQISGSL